MIEEEGTVEDLRVRLSKTCSFEKAQLKDYSSSKLEVVTQQL